MVLETNVLRSDKSIDQIRRNFIIMYIHPVTLALIKPAYYFHIGRINLRGEFVFRIFHILYRRHISYPPPCNHRKGRNDKNNDSPKGIPHIPHNTRCIPDRFFQLTHFHLSIYAFINKVLKAIRSIRSQLLKQR